jgi:hypothetical protein
VRDETVDEQQSGFNHQLVIPSLVLGEPLPIIVAFQLAQKLEQFWADYGRIRHWGLPCRLVNSWAASRVTATLSKPAPPTKPSRKWSLSTLGWAELVAGSDFYFLSVAFLTIRAAA